MWLILLLVIAEYLFIPFAWILMGISFVVYKRVSGARNAVGECFILYGTVTVLLILPTLLDSTGMMGLMFTIFLVPTFVLGCMFLPTVEGGPLGITAELKRCFEEMSMRPAPQVVINWPLLMSGGSLIVGSFVFGIYYFLIA